MCYLKYVYRQWDTLNVACRSGLNTLRITEWIRPTVGSVTRNITNELANRLYTALQNRHDTGA